MKRAWVPIAFVSCLAACQDNANLSEDYTGNEAVYPLAAASEYAVNGTVSLKERKDGSTLVLVELTGTEGSARHPVHLHLGNMSTADAPIAALLSPVEASSGRSETILKQLADETLVSYADIKKLEACIKVHLSDTGEGRDVVLAAGNIGAAFGKAAHGRLRVIATCKSE